MALEALYEEASVILQGGVIWISSHQLDPRAPIPGKFDPLHVDLQKRLQNPSYLWLRLTAADPTSRASLFVLDRTKTFIRGLLPLEVDEKAARFEPLMLFRHRIWSKLRRHLCSKPHS